MTVHVDLALLELLTERVRSGLDTVSTVVGEHGIDPNLITIIAVTKGWGPEAPLAALANGLCWFGENYADELLDKAAAVSEVLATALGSSGGESGDLRPKWTFQGKLQSNKINRLKGVVELWQTVDSVGRATALGSRVRGAEVLVQVVLEDSGDRSGCSEADVPEVLGAAQSAGLVVRGLMGVAPDLKIHGAEAVLNAFRRLSELGAVHQLRVLSMGMSDDFALALSCGATHLRLGSVLFGPRGQ